MASASMVTIVIKKTLHLMCSRSKPLLLCATSILIAIICYYTAEIIHGDSSDLRNMKHGFIKIIPEHLSSFDNLDPKSEVKDTLRCAVPPIVHYVWCRKDNFQFQHYLSVLSAYKLLKPTEIIFHYVSLPEMDNYGYYQFYGDLLRDLPNFFPVPLEDNLACSDDNVVASESISKMFDEYGGIFIGLNIILSRQSLKFLDKPFSGLVPDSREFALEGLLFQSRGVLDSSDSSLSTQLFQSAIKCRQLDTYKSSDTCAISHDELFPYQIFTLESGFGELARHLAYGKTEILKPVLKNERIPNIVHYIWLDKQPFSYFAYLSILGSLFVQKAETVYVHGDVEPMGQFWKTVSKTGKVKFIMRDFPKTVYGHDISDPYRASDYLRLDILRRYGGIYVAWNFLWTKELSEHQRRHDAIACYDWSGNGKFPAKFHMGILGSVKGSPFVNYLMETFRHFLDSDTDYNAMRMPYKVYEQHPESLFVDLHLQVVCSERICHPMWLNEEDLHATSGGAFDLKTDTNGVHWTDSNPEEYADQQTLLSSESSFAEIGQNILRRAGLIQ